jgi:hypothetical protein
LGYTIGHLKGSPVVAKKKSPLALLGCALLHCGVEKKILLQKCNVF